MVRANTIIDRMIIPGSNQNKLVYPSASVAYISQKTVWINDSDTWKKKEEFYRNISVN